MTSQFIQEKNPISIGFIIVSLINNMFLKGYPLEAKTAPKN